jgi:hypothetical protein
MCPRNIFTIGGSTVYHPTNHIRFIVVHFDHLASQGQTNRFPHWKWALSPHPHISIRRSPPTANTVANTNSTSGIRCSVVSLDDSTWLSKRSCSNLEWHAKKNIEFPMCASFSEVRRGSYHFARWSSKRACRCILEISSRKQNRLLSNNT